LNNFLPIQASSCGKNKTLKKPQKAPGGGKTGMEEFRPKRENRAKAEKK
jgi:hypothetical protein